MFNQNLDGSAGMHWETALTFVRTTSQWNLAQPQIYGSAKSPGDAEASALGAMLYFENYWCGERQGVGVQLRPKCP